MQLNIIERMHQVAIKQEKERKEALKKKFLSKFNTLTRIDSDVLNDSRKEESSIFNRNLKSKLQRLLNDKLLENKHFFNLGVAISNFINIQLTLLKGFTVMCIISIIQIILIKNDTQNNHDMYVSFQDEISEYGMGAYQQSHSICHINEIAHNHLNLRCPGTLKIIKLFSLGIVKSHSQVCLIDGNQEIEDREEVLKCNKHLDQSIFD